MRLVVDSSVVVQLLVAGRALGPLAGHELMAPALLASEVTSVLREMVFRGEMPAASGAAALDGMLELTIAFEPPGSVAVEATAIAGQLGWARTYDAEYVALARRANCPLVTMDTRLLRGGGRLADVRLPSEL